MKKPKTVYVVTGSIHPGYDAEFTIYRDAEDYLVKELKTCRKIKFKATGTITKVTSKLMIKKRNY